MHARMPLLLGSLLASAAASASGGPIQPEFRLANFHAPLVIDNIYSPMQPGTRTVFNELEDGECKVDDVVVTGNAKHDFHGAYAGLSARAVTDRVWGDPHCNGTRGALLEDTTDSGTGRTTAATSGTSARTLSSTCSTPGTRSARAAKARGRRGAAAPAQAS
jgi:hypothetical protein